MNWLTMYLNVFTEMPITTTIASFSIFFIIGVFVASLMFDLFVCVQNYWDRYETAHTNKFNKFFAKLCLSSKLYDCRQWKAASGYWVRAVSRKDVEDMSHNVDRSYDKIKKYYLRADNAHGRYHHITDRTIRYGAFEDCGFNDFEELSHLTMRYSISTVWALLSGALIVSTLLAAVLDLLLFNFFLQTVVVLSVIALIAVVLKGGRALTDLKKSIAKLNGDKEAK